MGVARKRRWLPQREAASAPPLDLAATRRAISPVIRGAQPLAGAALYLHLPVAASDAGAMVAGFAHTPLTKRACSRLTAVALVSTALFTLCESLANAKAFLPFQWDPHIREYHQVRAIPHTSYGRLVCTTSHSQTALSCSLVS